MPRRTNDERFNFLREHSGGVEPSPVRQGRKCWWGCWLGSEFYRGETPEAAIDAAMDHKEGQDADTE